MAKARKPGGLQGSASIVKRLRLGLGNWQEELSQVCGYYRTYVGMIERGECNITIATPLMRSR